MPPRPAHHHAGPGGSPFPPLGLAATAPPSAHGSLTAAGPAASAAAAGTGSGPLGASTSSESPLPSGLPPPSAKVDPAAAQACRLQDAYWSDEEEDMDCPLCLEEIDLSDANFKPCPCGYQICRFCWHHIKQNLNGRCPACRRKYSDQAIEFKPMTSEEIKKLSLAKKQKEREKKELEQMNRKHLANMRVVQRNLVYVVGLSAKLAREELIPTLRSNEFFGQYGRISKILISKRTTASKLVMGTQESAIGVYVTYHRREDAARAIVSIDGSKGPDGKVVRASYGTTKYCTTYLRNLPCTNPTCTYLHEPADEIDSFTKEDLSTLRHAVKDSENRMKPTAAAIAASAAATAIPAAHRKVEAASTDFASSPSTTEASALPKTASWASGGKPVAPAIPNGIPLPGVVREQDLPPLSASVATNSPQRQKKIPQKPIAPAAPSSKAPPTGPAAAIAAAAVAKAAAAGIPVAPKARLAAAVETPATLSKDKESVAAVAPSAAAAVASAEVAASSPKAQAAQAVAAPPTDSLDRPKGVTTGEAPPKAPPGLPAAPPGLSKVTHRPPPGLSSPSSRSATPGADSVATPGTSSYQPSSSAQAMLDELRMRRSAEPEVPTKTPFPDFDDALLSFSTGDFCFNLASETKALALSNDEATQPGTAAFSGGFGAFAPLAGPPPGLGFGTPPPGIARLASNRSATASPAPQLGFLATLNGTPSAGSYYSGSFNPFDAGDLSTTATALADKDVPSPFAAIDQMRRTLSEERAQDNADGASGGAGGDEDHSGDDEDGTGAEASKRASRFDFAKKKEPGPGSAEGSAAPGSANDSPFSRSRPDLFPAALSAQQRALESYASAHTGPNGIGANTPAASGSDPLELSFGKKDITHLLGSVFDADAHTTLARSTALAQQQQQHQQQPHHLAQQQQPQQHHQDMMNGIGAYAARLQARDFGGRDSPYMGAASYLGPYPQQQPQQQQQQQRGGFGFGGATGGFGSNGLPPGLTAQQQHQAQLAQQLNMGPMPSWLPELQRGQQQQQGAGGQSHGGPYTDASSFLAQLNGGASAIGGGAQHSPMIDQRQRGGYFENSGSGNGSSNAGASNSSEPLLAQIMAAAQNRANFAAQQQSLGGSGEQQQGGSGGREGADFSFLDPAIVNMARNQQYNGAAGEYNQQRSYR